MAGWKLVLVILSLGVWGQSVMTEEVQDDMLDKLLGEMEDVAGGEIVEHLVQMMRDKRLVSDPELLKSTSVNFVLKPRFKLQTLPNGTRAGKRLKIPASLVQFLKSDISPEEQRQTLERVLVKFKERKSKLANASLIPAPGSNFEVRPTQDLLLTPNSGSLQQSQQRNPAPKVERSPKGAPPRGGSRSPQQRRSKLRKKKQQKQKHQLKQQLPQQRQQQLPQNLQLRQQQLPQQKLQLRQQQLPQLPQQKLQLRQQQLPQPKLQLRQQQLPQQTQKRPREQQQETKPKNTTPFLASVSREPKVLRPKKKQPRLASSRNSSPSFQRPAAGGGERGGRSSGTPGEAGVDYPTYDHHNMPHTSFSCAGLVDGGYYADVEARCQVFHLCADDGTNSGTNRNFSFLCPNGTLFDQETLVCGNWYNIECSNDLVEALYILNDDLDAEREFITLGLEVDDPIENYPWRNRENLR